MSRLKYAHAPEKKPYMTEKIIVPATSLIASEQNTRIPVMVVDRITMLKTPTRLTSIFGKILPNTLAPLRTAIWVFREIMMEKWATTNCVEGKVSIDANFNRVKLEEEYGKI